MSILKLSTTLFLIIFGVVGSFLFTKSLNADDGKLLEAYPPNVAAENFKLSDIAGDKHELTDFRGKHVLLNFWAMSCNVCKSEMTTLQSAYDLLDREDLVIISVHAGAATDGVESVLKLNEISYPVLFDVDLQLGDWGIPIMPTSFIVSPEGNIRYRAVGTRIWNSPFMIDFMNSILDSEESQSATSESL